MTGRRRRHDAGSLSKSLEIQMSRIQFHHKGAKDTKKKAYFAYDSLCRRVSVHATLGFLGVLGGKVFTVSTEKDTLPYSILFAISLGFARMAVLLKLDLMYQCWRILWFTKLWW